jgi:hypothetical protein
MLCVLDNRDMDAAVLSRSIAQDRKVTECLMRRLMKPRDYEYESCVRRCKEPSKGRYTYAT